MASNTSKTARASVRAGQRVDLPTIGPRTVAEAARAGLAGIAIVAGETIIAEPHAVAAAADEAKIFVTGIGKPP